MSDVAFSAPGWAWIAVTMVIAVMLVVDFAPASRQPRKRLQRGGRVVNDLDCGWARIRRPYHGCGRGVAVETYYAGRGERAAQ